MRAEDRVPVRPLPKRRWVTIPFTADYLDITERTVRQMIADGRLTGYRMNHKLVRLDLNEIDAAMTPYGGSVSA